MKKVYVLCLLTLAVVLADIVFFHSRVVSAQGALSPQGTLANQANRGGTLAVGPMTEYRVRSVAAVGAFTTSETIVGFSCAPSNQGPAATVCYVITK
jgi:hypothetical protein